jgi:hypothetical protein
MGGLARLLKLGLPKNLLDYLAHKIVSRIEEEKRYLELI